jgi:hypothetical protein
MTAPATIPARGGDPPDPPGLPNAGTVPARGGDPPEPPAMPPPTSPSPSMAGEPAVAAGKSSRPASGVPRMASATFTDSSARRSVHSMVPGSSGVPRPRNQSGP